MHLSKIPKFFKSLGFQIPFIIGIHFVLIVGVLVYALIQGYDINNKRTKAYGRLLNETLVYQNQTIVDSAFTSLDKWHESIKAFPEEFDTYCDYPSIRDLVGNRPQFLLYGSVTPDLIVSCVSTGQSLVGTDISDRKYLQKTVDTKAPSISGFQIGKASGKPSMNISYPLLNEDNEIEDILVLSLGLEWITEVILNLPIPQSSEILILDNEGMILASHPSHTNRQGKQGLQDQAFNYITRQTSGTFKEMGIDGINRTYTFDPFAIRESKTPDAYVLVGIPDDVFLSDINALRDKIIFLIITTFFMEFIIVTLYARFINTPAITTLKGNKD